jgi:hypothetical protein
MQTKEWHGGTGCGVERGQAVKNAVRLEMSGYMLLLPPSKPKAILLQPSVTHSETLIHTRLLPSPALPISSHLLLREGIVDEWHMCKCGTYGKKFNLLAPGFYI